jgi:hypothetical protein
MLDRVQNHYDPRISASGEKKHSMSGDVAESRNGERFDQSSMRHDIRKTLGLIDETKI